MKRTWSIVLGFLLIFLFLGLVNDVLEMGERLERIHLWLFYGWYVLVLSTFLWMIAIPVRWLMKAPVRDYGALFEEEAPTAQILDDMRRSLDRDQELEWDTSNPDLPTRRMELIELLKSREKETDDQIVQASMLAFLTAAISPNGFIDFLAVVYYNFRMVGNLVDRYGIRPSLGNILRILRSVFLTAFVVNQLEELELNEYVEEMVESFGEIATSKLLSKTLDSLMQGILVAFVTLKIGYSTKALLINPQESKKYGFRKSIRRAARKSLVQVVLPKSAASLPKGFGRMILLFVGKMKSSQPEMS